MTEAANRCLLQRRAYVDGRHEQWYDNSATERQPEPPKSTVAHWRRIADNKYPAPTVRRSKLIQLDANHPSRRKWLIVSTTDEGAPVYVYAEDTKAVPMCLVSTKTWYPQDLIAICEAVVELLRNPVVEETINDTEE